MSERDRKTFGCPPVSGVVDGIDLALLDPTDEDERRILIEAQHPELKQALDDGVREIRLREGSHESSTAHRGA
jgi:hypothetical protein